jgi:hypothetical protein
VTPLVRAVAPCADAAKNVDLAANLSPESPPAVREAMLARQESIGDMDLMRMVVGGLKNANAPLTPRRREAASLFAQELMGDWARRKRAQWERDPSTHPANKLKKQALARVEEANAATANATAATSATAAAPSSSVASSAPPASTAAPAKASAIAAKAGAPATANGTAEPRRKGSSSGSGTARSSSGGTEGSGRRGSKPKGDLPKPATLPAPRRQQMERVDA